ncbi:Blue-light-activated protein [Methanosarcinales archaeon]|nr:Blue-light-activated protein [Methanosarcinales archaeon]
MIPGIFHQDALFFGLYAILGGGIVPQANFYPASAINNGWFISWSGIPIQIFRALIAVGITWSLWNIVNIFNIEEAEERKRTEEKIREQSALLDKAHDAIGVCDLEQHLIYWNKGSERLYGWSAKEIAGKNANELLYRGESPRRIEAKNNVIEKGEWAGELYEVTKAGKEVIVESSWTLVRDDAGKPKSILVINTDITEKKKLEAQFLRSQRMESIGTLAGGIAHDLNNVLTPIMDGQTSVQAIRKINHEVKIIAVSGLTEKSRLEKIAHYTNAFLPKPYTAARLLKTIDEVLSGK